MTALLAALLAAAIQAPGASAQAPSPVPLEYQVKAAYLFNFTKFVEWPAGPATPLTICVLEHNPFGRALDDIVRGERVNGRTLETRVVRDSAGCEVLFVPAGVPATAHLRSAGARAMLTVGESPGFLRDGGMINFVLEDGKVRFEIQQLTAERARLRISSRLLRLARATPTAAIDERPAETPESHNRREYGGRW